MHRITFLSSTMADVSLNLGQKMSTNFNCNEQSDKNEVKEYGWRYQCLTCNFEVGINKAFPETCPGCHAQGWWGRLTTGTLVTMSGGTKTRDLILSQQENAVVHGLTQNNGVFEPTPGQGRGRPRRGVPGDLLNQLSLQGLSSRQIATDLTARGFNLSYKSVQRYFKRQGK